MKLKSKLVLAASSLLVLSGVAAGTGTYAWFTANTAAQIGANGTVDSQKDVLKLAVSTSATQDALFPVVTGGTDFVVGYTGTSTDGKNKLINVSGDGVNMFKALQSNNTDYVKSGALVATDGTPYLDFTLTFKHTNFSTATGQAMAVFLSKQSTITNSTPAEKELGTHDDIKNAMRVAIISDHAGAIGSDVLAYYAPFGTMTTSSSDFVNKYVNAVSNATDGSNLAQVYTSSTESLCATNYEQNVLDASYTVDANDSTASTITQKGYIGTIPATTESLVLHARVWLEGMATTDTMLTYSDGTTAQIAAIKLLFNGVSVINA